VLLSGAQAELLLVGARDVKPEIDPQRIARALERAPQAHADLRRIDLGTVTEIVGTFVGSADTLARATRQAVPVSDDRPLQEYGVRSAVGAGLWGIPASLVELATVRQWCPRCFDGDQPLVAGLDTYLALMDEAYHARVAEVAATNAAAAGSRDVLGSRYLGAVVPDTGAVHNIIGVALLRDGRYEEAAGAFREAVAREPGSPDANRNLGTALAEIGRTDEAIEYLRRAVEIDPARGGAQHELGSLLLGRGAFAEAARHFETALRMMPDSAAAHNDLGVALASMGDLSTAIVHFRRAVTLEPAFAEGQRNLAAALDAQRRTGS
jgi:Flp pilus assembly protein TadD